MLQFAVTRKITWFFSARSNFHQLVGDATTIYGKPRDGLHGRGSPVPVPGLAIHCPTPRPSERARCRAPVRLGIWDLPDRCHMRIRRCCKVQLLLSPPFLSRLPPRRSLPGGSSALLLPRMRGSWCRGSLATLSGRIRFNGRLACIRRHHGRNRFPGCLPYHGHLCHLGHCRCPCRPRPCRRRRRRRGQGDK